MIAMIVDVLPAPFGPSSATTEPPGRSNDVPCTATTAPYPHLSPSMLSMCARPIADIGFTHLRIGHHLPGRAVADHPALVEHDQAPRYPHDLFEIVLDQDHGHALLVDGADGLHLLRRFRL